MMMQEDICCINAVRDQAPSLAKFFPEMLAHDVQGDMERIEPLPAPANCNG